jgi:sigma-B regulation protein RsbU (phosphoserine phosphatase)
LNFSRAASGGRARAFRSGEAAHREKARLLAVARFAPLSQMGLAAAQEGAQVAATLLDAPVGMCTLVGERSVRIVGAVGLEGLRELPREPGLCVAAVSSGRPRIVERADLDRRTCEHSLVRGPAGLRSYAGVPMRSGDGFEIGTLAAGSPQHLVPEPRAMAALEAVARLVVAAFEAAPAAGESPLDAVTGLPAARPFSERLLVLTSEAAWERTWGAILVLEVDGLDAGEARSGPDAAEVRRALAQALRAALDGEAEAYAPDAGSFALVTGVGLGFEPGRATARVEGAVDAVRRAGFGELRVRAGIATYDERSVPQEAYRLAGWRAYAEKADRR